jgi:hypothetical protein
MPIILNTEPERVRRLEIGDSVILHTRATGDEVQKALEESMDRQTGRYDHTAAATVLMKRHIKGWENVFDCDGEPVPYGEDLIDIFVGGLVYAERLTLDAAITSSYVEAVEGKGDSSSGLSGTD